MLKEFVEAIAGLAVRGSTPTIMRDSADPRLAYLLHDGQLKEMTVQPPLHASVVDTFESLYESVSHFGGSAASVWHDREQVVALLDDTDRLETVELSLCRSQQFQAICLLPKTFDQRSLILFLKRNLAGAIDDGLIAIFRQIDFSKREDGGATVKHGEESLGRSVHAAIANALSIPEYMTATVRCYSNPGLQFPVTIRISVDIDLQRGTFELTPLPDEIVNAIRATQEHLGELLRAGIPENATVFAGTPKFVRWGNISTAAK